MRDIWRRHRNGFWTPGHKRSLYLGLILLAIAIVVQVGAGRFSARLSANASPADDIFLQNLPVVNLDFVIVGGAIAFWVVACMLLAVRPSHLLFGIKAIAVFIIVRSFFINLTPLAPYPHAIAPTSDNLGFGLYRLITFQGNFFFSGHTGFPFLMALIFWEDRLWRRVFLVATVIFGATMLLAHAHYSIDVFAAPFMVYGIYTITARLFKRDHALLARAQA